MLGGPQRPREPEPFGPTIAEVLGLVLGAALVSLAVRQEFAEGWPEHIEPVSLWHGMLMFLARAPGYLAVCVMPAALVRRQAFGGPMRPAEFAVGVAGMGRLVWALYFPLNLIDRGP